MPQNCTEDIHSQEHKFPCLPLQTLQHWPSGRIWSFSEQFNGGQVSVTFTKTPFWKKMDTNENVCDGKDHTVFNLQLRQSLITTVIS